MYSARRSTSYLTLLALSATILLLLYLEPPHHFLLLHLTTSPPPPSSGSPSSSSSPTKNAPIPKVIWYKLPPNGHLPSSALEPTTTCTLNNPDHEVLYLDDAEASSFVSTAFAHRPDIQYTFFHLLRFLPAVQNDMLRYMLLWDQGGVWLQVGTSCSDVPISSWINTQHAESASLVLAREESHGGAKPGDARADSLLRHRFATWVMLAKPGSPHLMAVVEDIVAAVQQIMRFYDVDDTAELTEAMTGDAVEFSGPGRLTRAVLGSLEKTLNRTVDVDEVSSVLMPKLIGDVLLMPRSSFSTGGSSGEAGDVDELLRPALATLHEIAT